MREIKFRAWDSEKKKMFYDEGGWRGSCGHVSIIEIYTGYEDSDEWMDYVLMQYTGLKDKNGKEIYEGDIVLFQITDKYDHKTQVTWQEYGAWDYGLGKPEEIEIIGNVYEHPELIKTT